MSPKNFGASSPQVVAATPVSTRDHWAALLVSKRIDWRVEEVLAETHRSTRASRATSRSCGCSTTRSSRRSISIPENPLNQGCTRAGTLLRRHESTQYAVARRPACESGGIGGFSSGQSDGLARNGKPNDCTTGARLTTRTAREWKQGELISDNLSSGPLLPINAVNGAVFGAGLQLNRACTAQNVDCLFSGLFARDR